MESWLTEALSSKWLPVAVAYLLGLLTGYVLWNAGRSTDDGDDEIIYDVEDDDFEGPIVEYDADAPPSTKLEALEAEIKNAKQLLSENSEEQKTLSEIIGTVDDAVKRANGRLKIVLKSIKRIKTGS